MFVLLWLPCSMVSGPLWLVMSVSTYPGWTAFTTRSSRESALNARCWMKLKALTATLDTVYAELGQPSCSCFPSLALLQVVKVVAKHYIYTKTSNLMLWTCNYNIIIILTQYIWTPLVWYSMVWKLLLVEGNSQKWLVSEKAYDLLQFLKWPL